MHQLLYLSDLYSIKEIFPISLKEEDKVFQPKKLPENTLM